MRFDTSQHMRMSQQMKLGPRMIQSMEILQMPMMALQERVDQELESNVALEIVEPGRDADAGAAERDDALFAALADTAQVAGIEVQIAQPQPEQLAHPEPA